ncbi:hypothetical protein M9H77_23280 [Catharanthus roseus]|uniref:Uncharacterized protein n=1 Tax=Catharanthus roseus TaxID=4058 RepID=A0ACC0ASH4_CATRO|nr:hypothetical protein M9H77_23280 [Catharanthus roseus]
MLDLGSDDLVLASGLCPWSPTVALHVSLNSGVEVALMCLDSLRLPSCARNPHFTAERHADTLLSRRPNGRVGGIIGGIRVSSRGTGGAGSGAWVSIEEDPSEADSDIKMLPEHGRVAPVDAEGIAPSQQPVYGYCLWSEQQAMARAAMLETELVQVQEAHVAREREILDLIDEWDWLRRFIAQFLITTRDSVDRACVELESWPGELLEVSTAVRRNERVPAPGADEALERILKFLPPEFYGEVEQEIKDELFLKQLNDIYDTLKYENDLRVTFVAFRLLRMAKDWWLRASEARALKNQPWTWNDFQEEFKKEYIPQGIYKVCTYCERSGHVAEVCYQKSRLSYRCGKPGHVWEQCPDMQQAPPVTSRRIGRPRAIRGATEGRSDKPQMKVKVHALDGLPVDTKVEVVEGVIQIFSQPARELLILELHILLMDWLSRHYAQVVYRRKLVKFNRQGIAPFEALYGKKCITRLHWNEVGVRSHWKQRILMLELEEMQKQVRIIQDQLRAAKIRQKSYDDNGRRDLEFSVGDRVFLKLTLYREKLRCQKGEMLSP